MKTEHESHIKPDTRIVYQELSNGRWKTKRKLELLPFPSNKRYWFRYWSHGNWKASGSISLTKAFDKLRKLTVEESKNKYVHF